MVITHKTKEKFNPKWEGPFIVESVYSNGAYHLESSSKEERNSEIRDNHSKRMSNLEKRLEALAN